MSCPVASHHAIQNFDNSIDLHYTDGDKPPDLLWTLTSAPSLINLTSGTPYSADWRQFLSGGDPGATNITVVHVSGDNAITEGWTFASALGDNLTNDGTHSTGSGAFKLRATYLTIVEDSPDINWSYVTAVAGIRWNPDHYMSPQGQNSYTNAVIDDAVEAGMGGILGRFLWGGLEPTRGNYDWSSIDAFKLQASTRGLKCIPVLMYKLNTSNVASVVPPYLATEPNCDGGWYISTGTVIARTDQTGVIDRLLALAQAFATRYNDDTTIEGCVLCFDSAMPAPKPAAYSHSGHTAGYIRLIQALPTYCTKMNSFVGMDYLSGAPREDWVSIMAAYRASHCGFAAIDGVTENPDNGSDALRAFKGLIWDGADWVTGGVDCRGVVPMVAHISSASHNVGSAQTIRDIAVNTHGATHVAWIRKVTDTPSFGGTELYFDNTLSGVGAHYTPDVKTYVNTGGAGTGVNTGCPSSYGGACNL